MTIGGILPKVGVFLVATVVGGSVAFAVSAAASRPKLAPDAGDAPDFQLATANGQLAAFDLLEAPRTTIVMPGLEPDDLDAVAAALVEDEPPAGTSPIGFPRVDPISQFDGGEFAAANCTLAAGAMLARLGFGIVTTGTILRNNQLDHVGGTDLHDLQRAVQHAYGVQFKTGSVTPNQLRRLLTAGYGAVIQGVYGEIPAPLRLQGGFTGGHAIYLDGYFPGGAGLPAAYYVIDPIGNGPAYRGEWWPASIVHAFGQAFGRAGRIPAAWAFPPGGVPPNVIPDAVAAIPPDQGDGATETPAPGTSVDPSASPLSPTDEEPGADPVPPPLPPPVIDSGAIGGLDLVPFLTICLVQPDLGGCPSGVEGVFEIPPPLLELLLGPTVTVNWVDSDRPNVAFIGFTVEPSVPVDVRYWEADGSPPAISGPTSMASLVVGGEPSVVAELDVLAGTTYRYQVVAGDGLFTSVSPVGEFTTGYGVKLFDVALATATSPVLELEEGLSPYVHAADGAFAPPLLEMVGGARPPGCLNRVVEFGADAYCVADVDVDQDACETASVAYSLEGIDASGVLVRAFPTTTGTGRDGLPTLTGIVEADGPPGSGEVELGCLAEGLTYSIVIDAIGDADGILSFETLVVP